MRERERSKEVLRYIQALNCILSIGLTFCFCSLFLILSFFYLESRLRRWSNFFRNLSRNVNEDMNYLRHFDVNLKF